MADAIEQLENAPYGPPKLELARKLNIAVWIITVAVLGLVIGMRFISLDVGVDFSILPPIHATLNALAAVALIYAFVQIKRKNVDGHKRAMVVALAISTLFLVSYVLYHITTEAVRFGGEGAIRYVYFFFLITHVILAALIFPFILFTFVRSYTNQIEKHRRMARWVFPIWLYVAITGPICYLMLMPYYPS